MWSGLISRRIKVEVASVEFASESKGLSSLGTAERERI